MPLPTFIIVGAQKCGTSSLTAMLRSHPQIHMSRPKELHFFDRNHQRGLEFYAGQFQPRPHHVAIGEATPVYMYDPSSRERISDLLPEVKLVVILRDPVSRAYSHFWHSKRLGFDSSATFEDALEREPERLSSGMRSDRIRFSYVARGHYLEQLEALEARHGATKIHTMLLDDLKSDRVATLERLFSFLGVDTAQAASTEEKWTNRYRVTDEGGAQKIVKYPPMEPATRARLTEHFTPHNERLAEHLGRDLSGWNRS